MASIYLVNALYNKPNAPAAPTMQPVIEVKQEAIESDEPADLPAFAADQSERATESTQPETQAQQHDQQSGSVEAMHPSRLQMVSVLGPLEEQSEPVYYKVSGANKQPLGQTALPAPRKRGKGAANKQNLAESGPSTPKNIQAARERSFQAVAASAAATARLGQHLQAVGGNRIISGRDPRRRTQAGEGQETSSSPVPPNITHFDGFPIKLEEAPRSLFPDHPQSKLPASATVTASSPRRAESAHYHPMVGRGQFHRPAGPAGVIRDALVARPKFPDSDPASESETRIRELEDENLSLRKEGFCKDREIRKLKTELLSRGARTVSSTDQVFPDWKCLEAGVKRPRTDDDVGGPGREP